MNPSSLPGGGNGNSSNIFVWKNPWTEEPGGLQSTELDMTEVTQYTHNLACSGVYVSYQTTKDSISKSFRGYLHEKPLVFPGVMRKGLGPDIKTPEGMKFWTDKRNRWLPKSLDTWRNIRVDFFGQLLLIVQSIAYKCV